MQRSWTRILRAVALALLVAALPAGASDPARPVTLKLEPKPLAGVEQGRAVVVKGEAGEVPQRFLLEGITYLMPVAVALRPVDAGDEVGLSITKYAWNQPLREGTTDGEILRYLFRTEGEFQVSVTAADAGTPYRLLVWVGDETKPALSPVVVKASEFEDGGGGWWKWVIGIALALTALLALVWKLRRKSS